MRSTCCSARPASSPTTPPARSPARSPWTTTPKRSAGAGTRKASLLGITRIGAHAGPAIVGNFGGGRLFDYTAYGDTINVAARLEAANKQLGTRICVSAALAARVEHFRGRPVGDLVLRGRSDALRAFEPLAPEHDRDAATQSYLEAFAKLESDDPGAIAAFAALVGQRADDLLASFHLKRLLNGATGTRIAMD